MPKKTIFSKDDTFESKRLYFRSVKEGDGELLFKWRCTPHVYEHARTAQAPSREEHDRWFARHMNNIFSVRYIIVEKSSGSELGVVACDSDDEHCELSYYLGEPSAQGKGYMKEALVTLFNHLATQYEIGRLMAETRADNLASIALIEKLGGVLFDEYSAENFVWRKYQIPLGKKGGA